LQLIAMSGQFRIKASDVCDGISGVRIMNIVDLIKSQLSGVLVNRLSSLIGGEETQTRSAIGAAVPALLSGFASLVSSNNGAQKLLSSMNSLGNLDNMLSAESSGSVQDHGSSLLNSFFGSSKVSEIAGALSSFSGLKGGSASSLLGYLAPMILGTISKLFEGKPLTPQSLSSLFTEQKANIANSFPAGFPMGQVPQMREVGTATRDVSRASHEPSSPLKWLTPLLAICLLGLLGYYLFFARQSPAPIAKKAEESTKAVQTEAKSLSNNLSTVYTSLKETLTGIKDEASAQAALPRLEEINRRLDTLKTTLAKLPQAGCSLVASVTRENLGSFREQANRVLAIPGVGETLRPSLEKVLTKLPAFVC
jgi:hypothetical protein